MADLDRPISLFPPHGTPQGTDRIFVSEDLGGGSFQSKHLLLNQLGSVIGSGYVTVQDEGTPVTQRDTLNFVGAGVSVADTGGVTTVTIPGGGGGSGYDTIQDEGTPLTQESVLDFQGAGVTAAADTGKTIVTIPGGYDTVQDEGVPLTQESVLDFQGAGVTAAADTGKTIITIPGGYSTVQDEGTPVAQEVVLDFVGAGVTAAAGTGKTLVTIPGGYATVQDEGVPVAQEPVLDFVGAGVTASAGTGKTIVTIPGGGGSGGYDTIEDEGTPLAQESVLNFVGAGVTASAEAGKTTVTIPGGGGSGGAWEFKEIVSLPGAAGHLISIPFSEDSDYHFQFENVQVTLDTTIWMRLQLEGAGSPDASSSYDSTLGENAGNSFAGSNAFTTYWPIYRDGSMRATAEERAFGGALWLRHPHSVGQTRAYLDGYVRNSTQVWTRFHHEYIFAKAGRATHLYVMTEDAANFATGQVVVRRIKRS